MIIILIHKEKIDAKEEMVMNVEKELNNLRNSEKETQ